MRPSRLYFTVSAVIITALCGSRLSAQDSSPALRQTITPCPSTSQAENKALVQRYFSEVWRPGGTDIVEELLAPDEVHHWGIGSDTTGTAAFKERLKVFLAAFPDIHFAVERLVAETNMVVAGWTATATHQGPFAGIAATGRKVTWTGINIFQITCGKISESWGEADHIELRKQLGALPESSSRP